MPLLSFAYPALEAALAARAGPLRCDRPAVLDGLASLGCAVEAAPDRAELAVEALMNRPDLFSVEGLARALTPFLRLAPPPSYAARPGPLALEVDPSVEGIRGEVAAAVVRSVPLTDEGLARLIDAQEKLDLTYGRKRARVSIGLHDAGPLSSPITYKAVAPLDASFVPLGSPGGAPLTLQDILATHPKGREYAHLLQGKPRFPLLVDARGTVLSMPPIINGTPTELKPGTRDIFLDVTGTSRAPVAAAALLLAVLLADRGGTIEAVLVKRPHEPPSSEPALAPRHRRLPLERAACLLGLPLRADEAAAALERLGHRASIADAGASLDVAVPPWRFDVMHDCDLVEDIAIGLGLAALPHTLPSAPTLARELPSASARRRLRTALVGLGYLEVVTLTLSPADSPPNAPHALVANPLSRDHAALRGDLVPSLLAVLAANTHRDLPQAIFEVGEVVPLASNSPRAGAVCLAPDASFSRAKGLALALLETLGIAPAFVAYQGPPFARGRAAQATASGRPLLTFGELSPQTLARFDLVHPAFALEADLANLP